MIYCLNTCTGHPKNFPTTPHTALLKCASVCRLALDWHVQLVQLRPKAGLMIMIMKNT